jgi:hypothetical protein
MAVHATSGSLTANTAVTSTLTGWEKYVLVTVTNSGATAGTVSVTTDGVTATNAGADTATVVLPASGTVTIAVKNNFPKPQLSTTTPLATDPSASAAFTAYGSKVSVIATQNSTYNIDLAEDNGTLPIYS